MTNPTPDSSGPAVPASELWTSPISWGGSPLRGVEDYSREFPAAARFVRGEIVYTLSKEIGPGMTKQTEKAVPCLIALDKSKPIEVHAIGMNGGCWTYRLEKKGRKAFWRWYAGETFPATTPAPKSLLQAFAFDRFFVQSILPNAATRKHVSFMVRDDFSMEDMSKAVDEDPLD